jgi:hypothetical protein
LEGLEKKMLAFGIFYGYLIYFTSFWYILEGKIWQPWSTLSRPAELQIKIKFNHLRALTGYELAIVFSRGEEAFIFRLTTLKSNALLQYIKEHT